MSTYFNNLPNEKASTDSSDLTIKLFDTYTDAPVVIDASSFDAISAFFGSRGFDTDAAQNTAYVIIRQAKLDNINPFTLLDTLKGLDGVQLNNLITELLNYNRYKSSSLGVASPFVPMDEVARNIIA